jgi:DNA-binding GntR family transcriptional regulator
MSMTRPVPRSEIKLRERAYDEFTHHLLRSNIKPGQFVSQRELVALTGQPLGAIRELIPRLETEGLIVTVPQRGLQILPLDISLIRNAFQFRLILEREAIASFTQTASDSMIGRIEAAHQAIVTSAREGVTDEIIAEAQKVDRAFHETVIDELNNDIISKAYRVNWIKVRLIRQNETTLYDALVTPVMQEHLSVIGAIERRDEVGAVTALTRHINNARSRAMRIVPASGSDNGEKHNEADTTSIHDR